MMMLPAITATTMTTSAVTTVSANAFWRSFTIITNLFLYQLGGSGDEDETRTSTPNQLSSSKGKERFFWQYNVQAKGPKGKRLVFQSKLEDPHVLNEVTDPVFSPTCSVRGIKVYKVGKLDFDCKLILNLSEFILTAQRKSAQGRW